MPFVQSPKFLSPAAQGKSSNRSFQLRAEADHILIRRLQPARRMPDAGRGDFTHGKMR